MDYRLASGTAPRIEWVSAILFVSRRAVAGHDIERIQRIEHCHDGLI